jgi:ERCC4-type nuclease
MDIILAIDDREQSNIMNHIKVEFSQNNTFKDRGEITYIRGRYEAADYLICDKDLQVLCAIERKSLTDYGASIKDGRHENRHKMLKLREETNCEVYYIVEGTMTNQYNKEFGGLPYKTILSSMRKLQIRDDIRIIRTRNLEHTAKELKFLCEVYSQLTSEDAFREVKGEPLDTVIKLCGATENETLLRQVIACWSSFKGISSSTAVPLSETYTLEALIGSDLEGIDSFRVNDRLLNKPVRTTLQEPLAKEQQVKILSCIKGISSNTAKNLLSEFELKDFLDPDKYNTISKHKVGNRKFGNKKLDSVLAVFKYEVNQK